MMGHAHNSRGGSKKVQRTKDWWAELLVRVLGLTTADHGQW